MKLSYLYFSDKPDLKWSLSNQMGVRYAIAKLAPELTGKLPPWDFKSLKSSKEMFKKHGLKLVGLEGDQMDMIRIKLGLHGRDEDIEKYKEMLFNMGKLGINLLCYNFMATGWFRTNTKVLERGGAYVTSFSAEDAVQLPLTQHGKVSSNQIWENYRYFIKAVIPTAEKMGVIMALHPDDPPVPELQGIGRIFINAQSIRKALSIIDSPSHGLTFCQGTFTTMGEKVSDLIEEFGSKNKIQFVHIRDVRGNPNQFRETFHDNGPTDMSKMLNLYKKIGFSGYIRSDHVPTMAGEENDHPGYGIYGNLFGIGYILGLMDALHIKHE